MGEARHTDWTGALLGGRYRLIRCLGRGGMGAVYEAMQEDLGRRVAVKVVHTHLAQDQDVLARFRREAQAAAALGHPNIVQVTDFQIRAGEPPFLVMEHLVGVSLGQAIGAPGGTLSQTRVAFITSQILSALAAAHTAGIVHRDLKPDNVFLTSIAGVGDIVKILDFGIAKLQAAGPDVQLTQTGEAIGTPVYMAPEQARGRIVDARTDLYATGVCMYEALTGRVPHDPPSYSALIAAILEDPPRPVRELRAEVDPAFAAIVHRALEKDPARRFQSADEMRAAVEPFARASVSPAVAAVVTVTPTTQPSADALAGPTQPSDTRASPDDGANRPSAPRASEPRAAEPRTRAPAADVTVLPRTAEQPIVAKQEPSTSGTAARASTRAQRGTTPVTSSRTLAKPRASTAMRWPWILGVSALAGAACVGSGLVVLAATSHDRDTTPLATAPTRPPRPPPDHIEAAAHVRDERAIPDSPSTPADLPALPTNAADTPAPIEATPPTEHVTGIAGLVPEQPRLPAALPPPRQHPQTPPLNSRATPPPVQAAPPAPTPPAPAPAPAPAHAPAPAERRRVVMSLLRVTAEPSNRGAEVIVHNFLRAQDYVGCFSSQFDEIPPQVFGLRYAEQGGTPELFMPGMDRNFFVDSCMRARLDRLVMPVSAGTTVYITLQARIVIDEPADDSSGRGDPTTQRQ